MIHTAIRQLVEEEQARQSGHFIETMPLDDYLAKLERHAEFLLHYRAGQIDGLVAFYCNDQSRKTAFISLVLTAPQARGRKVASGLIDGVLSNTRQRGFLCCELEVAKGNSAALALYQQKGFCIRAESAHSYLMSVSIASGGMEQQDVA